jgi:hypothetical protein
MYTQNAGKRPNTYKLLLNDTVRRRAEEVGMPIPDKATLMMMDRASATLKVRVDAAVL